MSAKKRIANDAAALAAEVQKWSESQLEQWWQLPVLCGRLYWATPDHSLGGRRDPVQDFRFCFDQRIWVVREPASGLERLHIDTDSGKIHAIERRSSAKSHRKSFLGAADSADILWLAGHLDLIDAPLIIRGLRRRIKEEG